MLNRVTGIVLTGLVWLGCNQRTTYQPTQKDTAQRISYNNDSSGLATMNVEALLNEKDLQLFCNNEVVPYCVLLPLHEFKEDFSDPSTEKAQHKFILKQDTAHFTSIQAQAFIIDKKNYHNTQLFYRRDKNDIEEGGLGIDTAYMDESRHFYMIKGYLPNYANIRYAQLNWILEDRIAVYFNYDEKDEAIWKRRIAAIIKRGISFKNE